MRQLNRSHESNSDGASEPIELGRAQPSVLEHGQSHSSAIDWLRDENRYVLPFSPGADSFRIPSVDSSWSDVRPTTHR
jgi:hypothetical protein